MGCDMPRETPNLETYFADFNTHLSETNLRKNVPFVELYSNDWLTDFLQLRMCFNRFFRVSKQLNGIWHQLHFFSSFPWGETSQEIEDGDDIGVVSTMWKLTFVYEAYRLIDRDHQEFSIQ